MITVIGRILMVSIAVILSAFLLPGVTVDNFLYAILVAVVLSILNTIVKPILVIFTIPITVLTLGLFLLVINAIIIILTDSLIAGFHVENFWWALLFSLVLSVIVSIFESFDRKKKDTDR
ncbi:phage holin family protein [Halocola ammonii]